MVSQYKIGTNHAGLTYFNALTIPTIDPRGDPMDYAEYVERGDGARLGLGGLMQTLHWAKLTEAQATQLRGYIGSVNVLTRNNAGSFVEYTALLIWPEKEPEHYSNSLVDITVELRQMVIYS